MGRRRPALHGCQTPDIECLNDIADGLIVAPDRGGNDPGVLPTGAGQEDLAAP